MKKEEFVYFEARLTSKCEEEKRLKEQSTEDVLEQQTI